MSARGQVVVECDMPDCHAEQVLPAEEVMEFSGEDCLTGDGWETNYTGRWSCPQCVEEGKHP